MASEYEIVKGFYTDSGLGLYDYNSLANKPKIVKTINNQLPDEDGNIEIEGIGGSGEPGFSPIVEFSEASGGTNLTITDMEGTKTAFISDGKDGRGIDYIDNPDGDSLWIHYTDGNADVVFLPPTGGEIDPGAGGGGGIDLTGYAKETWVQEGFQPKGDYLKSAELPTVIDTALSQAKASGEFDGKDGADGKTPIKGTDYFTEADKQEIAGQAASLVDAKNTCWVHITYNSETGVGTTDKTSEEIEAEYNSGKYVVCTAKIDGIDFELIPSLIDHANVIFYGSFSHFNYVVVIHGDAVQKVDERISITSVNGYEPDKYGCVDIEIPQPNWKHSSSKKGHILNRTHYAEDTTEYMSVIPTMTLTSETATKIFAIPGDFEFEIDREYKITLDGQVYTCVAIHVYDDYGNHFGMIKDDLFRIAPPYKDEFGKYESGFISFRGDKESATSTTLSVETLGEIVIKKLDKKYLPDDLISDDHVASAVNEALAQAKASGEFKGDKGDPGEAGPAGADGKDAEGFLRVVLDQETMTADHNALEITEVVSNGGFAYLVVNSAGEMVKLARAAGSLATFTRTNFYSRDGEVGFIEEAVYIVDSKGQVTVSSAVFSDRGNVKSVNGQTPDENGNVEITIPDSSQNVDLTGYAKESWVQNGFQPKGNYYTKEEIDTLVENFEPSAFIVTTDGVSADKTNAEMWEAYQNARPTYLLLIADTGAYLAQPVSATATKAVFNSNIGDASVTVTIENGSVSVRVYGYADSEAFSMLSGQVSSLASSKLDASALPTAINTALAQAKASGEFKGDTGATGPAGKTPVKGTDYFTAADKAEMVKEVQSAIPTSTAIGKKLLFLGDSITASSSGWVKKIADFLKPTISVNVAVSGAHWCDYSNTVYDGNPVFDGADNNANNVIGNQVEKVLRSKEGGNVNYADFDIVFIAAGTNDSDPSGDIEASFYANGAVVPVASVDRKTWHGAFRYCVEKLQTAYPNAKIFICTPIQAVEVKRSYASIKAKGDYLKKLSARMSVNCIDTMLCGICGLYEANNANGRDLRDGLHTNDSGALKMAKHNAMMVMNYYEPEVVEGSEGEGEDEVVNLVTTSVDASGNPYGANGFIENTYISSSSPSAYRSKSGYVSTGFMPVSNDDSLYTSGTAIFTDNSCRVFIYDERKNFLGYLNAMGTTRINYRCDVNGNIQSMALTGEWADSSSAPITVESGIAFVRVCAKGTGENFIVSTKPIY